MADPRRARRRRRRAIIVGVAIGVVVCVAGGGVAWATMRPHTPSYRVASAQKADVTQTASLAGTVASATRADRAFQVSGTVASVGVKVGDTVTAGETLATLDTSVLDDSVTQSQQAVSTAQQKLTDDLASQTSGASTTTTASTTSDTGSALALGSFVAAPTSTTDLAPLEQAVTAAQSTLLADAQQLQTIATDMNTDLASLHDSTLTNLSTALSSVGTNAGCTVVADPSATPTTTDLQNCAAAISTALTAMNTALATTSQPTSSSPVTVTDALKDLGDAITALGTLQGTTLPNDESALNTAVANLQTALAAQESSSGGAGSGTGTGTGSSTGTGAGSGSGSGSGAATGSSRSGSSTGSSTGSSSTSGSSSKSATGSTSGKTSTPASAEQIVADQASLASAQANLAVAQQNLSLATLTSPIAGTVAAVGVSAGSSVSAGSTSQVISVIGDNGWIVDTAVTASQIGPLKVGQTASVNISGVSGMQPGKVTSIGFLNTSSDSSTPSYDVTLALSGSGTGLLNGASARLTVDVNKAAGVLTVPSSAVHLGVGNTYSVDVLSDGQESPRTVKVGAIGADRIQITSGLTAGEQVVLADLSSTVSSDSTQTSTRSGGLGGLTGGTGTRISGGTGGFGGAGGFGGTGGGFGGGTGVTGGTSKTG